MIGRILWYVVLACVAAATIGVQLDRQARKTPELATQVPAPFRSAAQPRVTALAIDSGMEERSLAEAQALVRGRPMPARHLRLLAQAHFAAGDNETSALVIQYAAQRGWRDSLAQEAMMQIALVAGDRSEAARRYAALFLIRKTDQALLEEAGPLVFPERGAPERAVFAEIVRGADRWQRTFLSRGARVMPPDAFVEVLELGVADGAEFDCQALEQARRTIERGDEASAKRLARLIEAQC